MSILLGKKLHVMKGAQTTFINLLKLSCQPTEGVMQKVQNQKLFDALKGNESFIFIDLKTSKYYRDDIRKIRPEFKSAGC
jgi:hypothetical protein